MKAANAYKSLLWDLSEYGVAYSGHIAMGRDPHSSVVNEFGSS